MSNIPHIPVLYREVLGAYERCDEGIIIDCTMGYGGHSSLLLDAYPNKPILAIVSKIAKKAEFTPKEVAVRADRITRVYEIRLKPLKPNPLLKLGIPAIGVVLIGNGSLPKSLNELPEL